MIKYGAAKKTTWININFNPKNKYRNAEKNN